MSLRIPPNGPNRDKYNSGNPLPGGGTAPAPDDYNEFSRIARQTPLPGGKRALAEVYNDEQLRLFDDEQYSELHFELQNVLKSFPNDINAHLGLGLCSMSVDEPERASVHFGKALEMDDSILPGRFINEVRSEDAEDWLMMAEGLGHLGYLNSATDICDRIAKSSRYSVKIRALATQTRQSIEQDFYAARERIITGNSPKQGEDSTPSRIRIISTILFVIGPLIFTYFLGMFCYSSYQLTAGKNSMQAGIYRLERLKNGDQTVDRNGAVEQYFSNASKLLAKSYKLNPLSIEPLYLQNKNAETWLKLGNIRKGQLEWSGAQFRMVKNERAETAKKLKERKLSKEKLKSEKEAWQEFYKKAKSDPGTLMF